VPLNFALVIFGVWPVRPPPESLVDVAYNPGVVWSGSRQSRPVNTPFQTLECPPHGFVEIIHVLSLGRSLQCLVCVETAFRQLSKIPAAYHLVLVWPLMRVRRRARNESTDFDCGDLLFKVLMVSPRIFSLSSLLSSPALCGCTGRAVGV
jgi:hypothetical protein